MPSPPGAIREDLSLHDVRLSPGQSSFSQGSIQRPLHRLRNDEITAVRHQVPAVYEALVQYDSLYLNAEARMEAKENELARCIEVGQEVLLQLHAVRQRCSEISDERDEVSDAKNNLERQVTGLKQALKDMERSFETQYRSVSTESAQVARELQMDLEEQKRQIQTLVSQLDATSQQNSQLVLVINSRDERISAYERQCAELEHEVGVLHNLVEESTERAKADAADIVSCGSLCSTLLHVLVAADSGTSKNRMRTSAPSSAAELRESMQQIHAQAAELKRQNTAMEQQLHDATAAMVNMDSSSQTAERENVVLRASLSALRNEAQSLEKELQSLKIQQTESPRRVQLMQQTVSERDLLIQHLNTEVADAHRDAAAKAHRISQLEQQLADQRTEQVDKKANTDFESRAVEAMHRVRISEQTCEHLKEEVRRQTEKNVHLAEVERKCAQLTSQVAELESMLLGARKELQQKNQQLVSKDENIKEVESTLAAVQSDLFSIQIQRDELQQRFAAAQEDIQLLKVDLQHAHQSESAAADLQDAREENHRLQDALVSLQRESRELHDALTRVATDEQQASTSILHKLKTVEAQLDERSREVEQLDMVNKNMKQTIREISFNESEAKESLAEAKKRLADFLQTHVPGVMFQELEKDFGSLREELHRIRLEGVALQEAANSEQRKREAVEAREEEAKQRHQLTIAYVKEWAEKVASIEEQCQGLGGGLNPSKTQSSLYRTGVSKRAKYPSGTATSVGGQSAARRPLFQDPSATLESASPNREPPPTPSIGLSPIVASTPYVATFTVSASSKRISDCFAEYISAQRSQIEGLQTFLSTRSTAATATTALVPPSSVVGAAIRLFDVSIGVMEEVTEQSQKLSETKEVRVSQLSEDVQQKQQEIVALKRKLDALQESVSGVEQVRQSTDVELKSTRDKLARMIEERNEIVGELEKVKSHKAKAEATAAEYRSKLEQSHADSKFESKTLVIRCEQFKGQLATERQEHQAAIGRLFDEISSLKQETLRLQSLAQDRETAEIKLRKSFQLEREQLIQKNQQLSDSRSDLEETCERYLSMLQVARREVEGVTETLNEVESTLQKDLQDCEAENHQLRAELQVAERDAAQLKSEKEVLVQQLRTAQTSQLESSVSTQQAQQYQRQLHEVQSRLEDSSQVITMLEERCRMQEEQNKQLQTLIESDVKEVEALRKTNGALEERLDALERDQNPLRKQLHELLEVRRSR